MKLDCLRIEDSERKRAACFTELAIVGLIAPVRAIQLIMARDRSIGRPVTDAVDPADMSALRAINAKREGRTEKLRNPHNETTLDWFAWIVARMDG